jgi:hypothetical protein
MPLCGILKRRVELSVRREAKLLNGIFSMQGDRTREEFGNADIPRED